MTTIVEATRACSIALLAGHVLHAENVTAGPDGSVIDWREVKCGETIQANGDAFDTAYLFACVVGPEAAHAAATRERTIAPAPPFKSPPVEISAFMLNANGGRRRAFEVGAFHVYVEPHENDAAQAAFTEALARAAAELS